jgi:hypothetical protein
MEQPNMQCAQCMEFERSLGDIKQVRMNLRGGLRDMKTLLLPLGGWKTQAF